MRRPRDRDHQEILTYIRDYTGKHGYPPSMKEITGHLGYASTSTTFARLDVMQARGLITREKTTPRTLVITSRGQQHLEGHIMKLYRIPVYVYVETGDPEQARETVMRITGETAGDYFLIEGGQPEELTPQHEGQVRRLKGILSQADETP
jgi:SOS-response transcriptional repressor LexA